MKKVIFGLIFGMVSLAGCSPRNYFLVNSDLVARYNRTTGNWEVIWNTSLKHRGMAPDSIPIIVSRDSIRQ